MRHVVVYYGTNAGVWVSIDDMHLVDTKVATDELVRGKVTTALQQRERGEPVGIFSPTGATYMIEESDGKRHPLIYGDMPPINYETISEKDLQTRLHSRLASIRAYLRDPEIEIKCIRGVPPT